MQEKAKEPEIRFAGFTGAWEQRKFSELYKRSSEKNDGSMGVDRFITVATMQFKSDIRVTEDEYLKTYFTFKLGDIAFEGNRSKNFKYGRFVENDIGDGLVSHVFIVMRPITNYDLYFWKYAIHNENLMRKILQRSTKSSTMMHDLVVQDFLNEKFSVPSLKEQKAIGNFLRTIDSLLTLHQRKYEKLLNIKKSMLEKMFPKEGEVVPEIRFKGFTGAWEQRKLNEIADVYDGVHQTPKYTSSGVRFLSVENIATLESEKYISEADFIRDFKIFPQKGDILMTRIGDIGTAKVIKSDEKYAFYVSLALLKPKHINSDFLCNSIASKNFQKGLKARSLLTAIPLKINKEEIGKVATSFPLNLSEQEKIGSFFNHIESLLTLHQRQSAGSNLPG